MLAESQRELIRDRCEEILRQNWREGVRARDGFAYGYTCPSPSRYPWQWYWDSCFHAISWRRVDPERSQRELRSLLAAQRDDGFIGHTIFWNQPLTGSRRYIYNVISPTDSMTASIQPPMLAWAAASSRRAPPPSPAAALTTPTATSKAPEVVKRGCESLRRIEGLLQENQTLTAEG